MRNFRTLLLAFPLVFALAACSKPEEPPLSSNGKDTINDALDRRPHEQARDAVEDIGDAAKRAGEDVKDAVKDATK